MSLPILNRQSLVPPSYYSVHPEHCKRAIVYSVALRLKRNCSNSNFLEKRNTQYKQYLVSQGYISNLGFEKFKELEQIPRSDLLKPKSNKD